MDLENIDSNKRFCFAQDDSCHWYLIPLELKEEFENLIEEENDDTINYNFSKYRTSGGIKCISFSSPSYIIYK